jgi:phosphoadenosine phosphosulfate reductase
VDPEHIADRLLQYRCEGKRIFATSSFQTHSLVLLHIISLTDRTIPVWWINTGYLFPETVAFKDQIAREFGLDIREAVSDVPRHLQMSADGRLMFAHDPDYCCYLNKTQPTDGLLRIHDVWVNGVRADQSQTRSRMQVENSAPHNTIRFHPMLHWSNRDIFAYIRKHDLPRHPLDAQGYTSIGCEPCTRKPSPDMLEREARWYGLSKTECGLHTDLIASAS